MIKDWTLYNNIVKSINGNTKGQGEENEKKEWFILIIKYLK